MYNYSKTPIATIIIPAFNEEAIIGQTLSRLKEEAQVGEFDIIVACNGCTDKTATIAKEANPFVKVLTTEIAGKTNALNMALKITNTFPVIFLDADIDICATALRRLVHRINWSEAYLAYGSATFKTENSNIAVQAFYRAWAENPYFDKKKMGGVFAVSYMGLKELGQFPDVLNDDEYVRRTLIKNSVWVQAAPYIVQAPRNLWSLIKVRSRVYRGNAALENNAQALGEYKKSSNAKTFLTRLIKTPARWIDAIIFAFVTAGAHSLNWFRKQSSTNTGWDQDQSTRQS